MTKTAVVSGLHIRLDVPTKCKIVEAVLTKSFLTKKDQNQHIEVLASQNFINPVTIKLWCGKYQNTWKLGKFLPKGTMSFSFATIPDSKLRIVRNELKLIREILTTTITKSQTNYYENLRAADVETTKTPGSILDDLILNKKA